MPEISLLTWTVGIAALVIGILAGHFGWGRRWPGPLSKLHPDYLTGLDYLVTEQPDRALDMFLKLMDANADTIETHFSLGSLYRRRGEVERAIRIHQNLLARAALAPEHREQALLALAQDYLRAGLLDRAEGLFQQVSEVPRLRANALDSLRGVYERQHEWQQALDVYRLLARIKAAPPRVVPAHYLCELAGLAMARGDTGGARRLLREARAEVAGFPRAAVLRAQIAEADHDAGLAFRLLRTALREAPKLTLEELPHLLRLVAPHGRDAVLADLVAQAESRDADELKRLVFAAILAGLTDAAPLRAPIEKVFAQDATLQAVWQTAPAPDAGPGDAPLSGARPGDGPRIAREIGALLANAEKYRCNECGFSGRNFYWHCPACHAWDSFEAYAIVKLG
ncbi:MAG: tetratricopeptide repeat protein [Steroidobacteraceae bacterium]|jgi:lipopolysaccharide biosynthesis regulator YciM